MNEQLNRVGNNIAQIITKYVNMKAKSNMPEFHASEVRIACTTELGFNNVAPGSPDRVMRDLRQRKKINYVLVNRAKSLYRALPLPLVDGVALAGVDTPPDRDKL